MNDSVAVRFVKTTIGGKFLRDLRREKDAIIPEGVERIGKRLFQGSGVESVTIPASITTIEDEAFCSCGSLKRVVFAEGSKLERIGARCFCKAGVQRICVPKGV